MVEAKLLEAIRVDLFRPEALALFKSDMRKHLAEMKTGHDAESKRAKLSTAE